MSYTWLNDPISTSVKDYASHVTELRSNVDNERSKRSIGPYPWTDKPLHGGETDKVKTIHITQLRTAIDSTPLTSECSTHYGTYLNSHKNLYHGTADTGLDSNHDTTVQYNDDASAYSNDETSHYENDDIGYNYSVCGTYYGSHFTTHDLSENSDEFITVDNVQQVSVLTGEDSWLNTNKDFTYNSYNYSSDNSTDNSSDNPSYQGADNAADNPSYQGADNAADNPSYQGADNSTDNAGDNTTDYSWDDSGYEASNLSSDLTSNK